MNQSPFIFSDERKYRIRRHLVFWLVWWVFMAFLYSFSGPALNIPYFTRLPLSAIESLLYLICHAFLAYSLMYWVIPSFIVKTKYIPAVFAVIACFMGAAVISSFIGMVVLVPIRHYFAHLHIPQPKHITEVNFFLSLLAGLRGGITVGGLAAAIKLMKFWYVKEQRNLQLQKENMQAQLQLLKAQVHPHFLFNTLNNIYSYTQSTSPVAARLVAGLSDLLRYMLYEGSQATVPLDKELKMLQDYITLEQIRYGNRLEITLDLPQKTDNLVIAPLLLLPFVENCFKHGTSDVLEQPWVSLSITLEGEWMKMKLLNGKPENYQPVRRSSGIGMENAQKRLQLLYPEKFLLKIDNEEDVFIVNLKLQLERSQTLVIPAPEREIAIHA